MPIMGKSYSLRKSSMATLVAVFGVAGAEMPKKIKLENAKVRVSEVTYLPGVARERYTCLLYTSRCV